MTQTIVAVVQNRHGVLDRITTVLRKRYFDVHSLSMGRSERPDRSRLTVTVGGDIEYARRVASNLAKIVEVIQVEPLADRPAVRRGLALVKVAPGGEALAEVNALCTAFRARVVDVSPASVIVEITGDESKIDRFLELLEPFGICEMARSECVALGRGATLSSECQVPATVKGAAAVTN